MNRKVNHTVQTPATESNEIDALYVEFLKHFYAEGNRERAENIAARLQEALAASPELTQSIRGEEIRSLIAELHGDYQEAIRCREAEIRKILELHSLSVNTPSWEYVADQYNFSDVSDRLDLLALLYDRHGDAERAIATLRESRQYCLSHQIPFDAQDLLVELEQRLNEMRRNGVSPPRTRKRKTAAGKRRS